jgi:hypothetical protein
MGDLHRIPRNSDRTYSDTCFAQLLSIDPVKLKHDLSSFHTRPAYAYTKAEVGAVES